MAIGIAALPFLFFLSIVAFRFGNGTFPAKAFWRKLLIYSLILAALSFTIGLMFRPENISSVLVSTLFGLLALPALFPIWGGAWLIGRGAGSRKKTMPGDGL